MSSRFYDHLLETDGGGKRLEALKSGVLFNMERWNSDVNRVILSNYINDVAIPASVKWSKGRANQRNAGISSMSDESLWSILPLILRKDMGRISTYTPTDVRRDYAEHQLRDVPHAKKHGAYPFPQTDEHWLDVHNSPKGGDGVFPREGRCYMPKDTITFMHVDPTPLTSLPEETPNSYIQLGKLWYRTMNNSELKRKCMDGETPGCGSLINSVNKGESESAHTMIIKNDADGCAYLDRA